jgi:hypothetical protein
MLGFEICTSNGVYEINVVTFFKILNNVKSCIPLDVLTLNIYHKMDSINFIWNGEDTISLHTHLSYGCGPCSVGPITCKRVGV